MKLRSIVILALRGLDMEAKKRISDIAGVSVSTLNRWIAENDDNLIKVPTLKQIKIETGLEEREVWDDGVTQDKPLNIDNKIENRNIT